MAARIPLVLDASGEPQQLQSGDTLRAAVTGFFSVYRGTSQSVTAGSNNQISFATEVADDSNWFDNSTFKYTPQIAGTYFIALNVDISGTTIAGGIYPGIAKIRKNGSDAATGGLFHFDVGAKSPNEVISIAMAAVVMNGTTDYIDFAVYTDFTSPTIQGGAALTYAFGYLLK